MTNPQTPEQHPDAHYRRALDQAQVLSESRPVGALAAGWSAQAAHVGDMAVLALALRD